MNIKSTVYPPTTLTQNEWMQEFKISTQVPKYDGQARAKAIMEQWQEGETESIFKRTISKLKLPVRN